MMIQVEFSTEDNDILFDQEIEQCDFNVLFENVIEVAIIPKNYGLITYDGSRIRIT